MHIFVTGGTGFIGSNLVKKLHEQGHEITVTGSDAEQDVGKFVKKYLQPGLLGINWSAIGQIDVLYHEAAINDTTLNDRDEMLRANLSASMELFEQAVENGCKKIVYASSTAVYGNAPAPFKEDGLITPLNVYGESKKMLDEFATDFASQNTGITVVGLRYCNVYGPGEQHKGKRASMISQLAQQMKKGNPKLFKFGEQKRDWIYVDDVVRANLLAAEAKESCIVNCGSGSATSFNEIVKILNEVMGVERVAEYIDNPFADKYQDFTYCDMSKAAEKIGFKPEYDIKKGINHYYSTGKLISN
jgi:ADP-L-glycero-D-manno-heptose 6-epimerase